MATETAEHQTTWYIADKDAAQGPHDHGWVASAITSRQLLPTALVCPVGASQWRPAREWPQLAPHFVEASPPSRPTIDGVDVQRLALWHRRFTIGILGLLAAYWMASSVHPVLSIFGLIAVVIGQVVLTTGLAKASGSNWYWLYGLLAVVPYLGGLALGAASFKASGQLRRAGVKVGFFTGAQLPENP